MNSPLNCSQFQQDYWNLPRLQAQPRAEITSHLVSSASKLIGVTASALMGVLEPLIGNLSSVLLLESFDKIKNVHSQIEFLRDELSSMRTTLETMSQSDEQSPQTQVWMNQLRELCYDIEDRMEENFMHLGQDSTSEDGFIQ